MISRFIVDFDKAANEGRLHPRGTYDWPKDVFAEMRQTFQLAYSHDRERVFVGTIPQVEAACRWLTREGLSVGSGESAAPMSHAPVSCAACRDFTYRTRDLPDVGTPCQGCGEPLKFSCESDHPGSSCAWESVA